jgi:hypothetical protein
MLITSYHSVARGTAFAYPVVARRDGRLVILYLAWCNRKQAALMESLDAPPLAAALGVPSARSARLVG